MLLVRMGGGGAEVNGCERRRHGHVEQRRRLFTGQQRVRMPLDSDRGGLHKGHRRLQLPIYHARVVDRGDEAVVHQEHSVLHIDVAVPFLPAGRQIVVRWRLSHVTEQE